MDYQVISHSNRGFGVMAFGSRERAIDFARSRSKFTGGALVVIERDGRRAYEIGRAEKGTYHAKDANHAGSKKRPLSRAKKNVAARRRRKERQYAVPFAGSKTGGVGIATFQSRRQAAKYAEEIGVNPRSIRKNY